MIGRTIGHFNVVSRLGRGGMGEVYAGEHESIQTKVAIKVLHTDISQNHDHVQRFFNEAKIVGRIKHAGIVKIFDVGRHDGHAYLIMELLEGEPLAARIQREGKLSWHDTAELGRQIASVLDATHRAGIIHRDLKPDNIFLVQDHELARGERVKILDFGISKLSGTMAGGSPKTIGTMGTPAYMAPEQWGDSANVDWRADAYSLGCVLFEMVSGRPPFIVTTIADACAKHLQAAPPPLRDLAAIPAPLHRLVMQLLAKDPDERGPSMAQIARDLAAISADASATVSVPPAASASSSGVAAIGTAATAVARTTLGASAAEIKMTVTQRRRRQWVAGGAVAVLGVVALFVVMSLRSSNESGDVSGTAPGASSGATSGTTSGTMGTSTMGTSATGTSATGAATKTPDIATKTPDIATKTPDITAKTPDIGTKAPDIAAKTPDIAAKAPDRIKKPTDRTKKPPDTAVKAPDNTKKAPDNTRKPPDTTVKAPDTAKKPPDTPPEQGSGTGSGFGGRI